MMFKLHLFGKLMMILLQILVILLPLNQRMIFQFGLDLLLTHYGLLLQIGILLLEIIHLPLLLDQVVLQTRKKLIVQNVHSLFVQIRQFVRCAVQA
ncbi:hypothetical protein C1645_776444 [Glomus cerebriforme]|uniref:Uncharacterized protein n=1 Tax=Glomus cerebriforme TaxID=658196 RepID=A0A397SSB1_9GLOM|nr:hypothetical protein C1645_776444 [Glomus cerebriforme]